jgi:hypothetical protein
MTFMRTFMLALLMMAGVVKAFAQSEQTGKPPVPPAPTFTVSISAKGIRFAALGGVGQMRLEVFNMSGDTLYNSEFQAGNVQEWALEDKLGQRLPDASYLCVITARDLSGRLSLKQSTVLVQGGQAALKLGDGELIGALKAGKDTVSPEFNVNEDLAINGNINFTPPSVGFTRDITMQNNNGGLRFFGAPALTNSPAAAAIQFWGNNAPFPGQLYLDAGAHDSGAVIIRSAGTGGTITERMRVTATGNVGIGTDNPMTKLDVAGDIQVSGNANIAGNIAAKYQDVAEWVPARQPLAARTVVVLDKLQANSVVASSRAYDTHIAGVVSSKPGVVLGEGGAGKVLVATTGRVKVKVDATRRPINIGDLLVSSRKPGMAMRSRPIRVGGTLIHRPGTIIGKALEPLASGEGEILVLLSLQ